MTAVSESSVFALHNSRRSRRNVGDVPIAPFFLLGVIMPINMLQGVPPIALDILRYGLALIILYLLRSYRKPTKNVTLLELVAVLLILSGGLFVLKTGFLGGSLFSPLVSFVSPFVGYLVVRKQVHLNHILMGFSVGAALSAFDIVLQVLGLPFIGMPTAYGFRYSGFSFSSTSVAPLLAIAICITISSWVWGNSRIILRSGLTIVLVAGLFLSNGRVGVLGLIFALGIYIVSNFIRYPVRIFSLVVAGSCIGAFLGLGQSLLNFFTRANVSGAGDITSGRGELNSLAWEAFWRGGLLGIPPSEYENFNPHIAPLSFGLNVGPFGLFSMGLACLFLAVLVLSFHRENFLVFSMIASVALTTSFVDSSGFFVGFTGTILTMICFASFSGMDRSKSSLDTASSGT